MPKKDKVEPTEWRVEMMDPAALLAHPDNPKVHPDRQAAALDESLDEFGWLAAPIFNERSGRLVDGHLRAERAIRRGDKLVPTRVIDVDEATERRILATFDRVGELRGYDDETLAGLLRECAALELPLPGWSEDDLADLLLETAPPAPEEFDQPTAQAPEAATAQAGAEPPPSAQVRMVQLFYDVAQHERFQAAVERLREAWELPTPSDVVLAALEAEAEAGDANPTG